MLSELQKSVYSDAYAATRLQTEAVPASQRAERTVYTLSDSPQHQNPNTVSSALTRCKFRFHAPVSLDGVCCSQVGSIPGASSQPQVGLRVAEPTLSPGTCQDFRFRGVYFCSLGSCCNNKILLLIHQLQILGNSFTHAQKDTSCITVENKPQRPSEHRSSLHTPEYAKERKRMLIPQKCANFLFKPPPNALTNAQIVLMLCRSRKANW